MKLTFATNNQHKLKEVQNQLGDTFVLGTLLDLGCDEDIPETSDTIEGNAIQKVQYIWDKYQVNCFADDTGLLIDSLNGEPGVYSARYAGEQKDSNDNMDLVLKKLVGKSDREAQFQTTIAIIIDGELKTFDGVAKGTIREKKSGHDGFGYDPIFQPEGFDVTFSEMSMEEKNAISHRGKAVAQLIAYLKEI
jgi:XTP/dITP diphosphohydrolase